MNAGRWGLALFLVFVSSAVHCSPAHLADLRNYYELKVGPFESKQWPRGAMCHIGVTCHCDWNSSYLIESGGIGGPSKQCGLESYNELVPQIINGRKEVAAREFQYSQDEIISRYGLPTFSGDASGWRYISYCTLMDGRILRSTETTRDGQYFQYAFAFSGPKNSSLSEIDVSWTKHCDPNRLGGAPIP